MVEQRGVNMYRSYQQKRRDVDHTFISDRGDFVPFRSTRHSLGLPTLPMSTNKSDCWCPAVALGPERTSATCSAVVGTTGVKEQRREG